MSDAFQERRKSAVHTPCVGHWRTTFALFLLGAVLMKPCQHTPSHHPTSRVGGSILLQGHSSRKGRATQDPRPETRATAAVSRATAHGTRVANACKCCWQQQAARTAPCPDSNTHTHTRARTPQRTPGALRAAPQAARDRSPMRRAGGGIARCVLQQVGYARSTRRAAQAARHGRTAPGWRRW